MKFGIRLLSLAVSLSLSASYVSYGQCSTSSSPTNNCGSYGDQIDKVTINGVSTTSGSTNGCSTNGYGSFSSPVFKFLPGATNSYSASLGSGTESEGLAIYMDLNNDGVFSGSSELVHVSSSSGTSLTGSFTVPTSGVVTGTPIKMRLRCAWLYTSWTIGQACTSGVGTWGETEDYNVILCDNATVVSLTPDTIVCENGSVSLQVNGTNAGAYQWQVDLNGSGFVNISNGATYSGTQTNTLTINNAPLSLSGAIYQCVVTNDCYSAQKVNSNPILVTVNPLTKIIGQSSNDTTCEGINTKLWVKADGIGPTYQWQVFIPGQGWIDVPNAAPYSGINSDSLNINAIPDTLNGYKFRVIVSSLCGSETSLDMQLTVNSLPKVIADPLDVQTREGMNANFQVTAAGVGIKYQWQAGVNGSFSNINNNGIYSGVKTDRLSVTAVAMAQNGFQFRCIIEGAGNCATAPDTSNVAILTVDPPLSITSVGSNNSDITVYPNPTSGNEIMVKTSSVTRDYQVQIIDKLGRVVSTENLSLQQGTNATIQVSKLAAGVYILQFTDIETKQTENIKFTKE